LTVERRAFYDPEKVVEEVLIVTSESRENIDYITFVPDGEPTLDINLGKMIKKIKEGTKCRIAVITNGSLMTFALADLAETDLISVKVDATVEEAYKRANRPHPNLSLPKVLEGIKKFREIYRGILITETMLLEGVNDSTENMLKTVEFLGNISPHKAYISVPVRPPAEGWVRPSPKLPEWYEHFTEAGIDTVKLDYQEDSDFGTVGSEDPINGVLKIVSVHPLREDYVRKIFLKKQVDPDKAIHNLLVKGRVRKIEYSGNVYLAATDSEGS